MHKGRFTRLRDVFSSPSYTNHTHCYLTMIRTVTLCVVVSLSAFALWSYSSSTVTPQIGPFSNRVILIRHGEKGPQSLLPSSDDAVQAFAEIKDNAKYRGPARTEKYQKEHHGDTNHKAEHEREDEHVGRHRAGRKGWRRPNTSRWWWWSWSPSGPPGGPGGPDGPPGGGRKGKFPSGLNDAGRQRAQNIRTVRHFPLPFRLILHPLFHCSLYCRNRAQADT